MFEKFHQPLLSFNLFLLRLLKFILFGLFLVYIALFIGMWGYHTYEGMSWLDAFVNASMILSGMGPLSPLHTDAGKLFAGFYSLFSGLFFMVLMGILFAPCLHRFLHKMHLAKNDE